MPATARLICLALTLILANAQTYYGTIRGVVRDSTGAVHPGVRITITNLGTNVEVSVQSNEAGLYVFPNLIPGSYRVTAEQTGFKKFIASQTALSAAQDVRIDIQMEVGAVTDSVTVTSAAQQIETERATLSEVKPREVFAVLPVNTNFRSLWRILALSPGVIGSAGSIAGNPRGSNSTFTMDGVPMIDGWSGGAVGPAFTFLDGYREFRVDVANVNASVGTTAAVTMVSDSGTNQFHGEGWLHYNAVGFTARPFFAAQRPNGPPTYRPNVKVGGPVVLGPLYNGKDRTFFHFTYQALRGSQTPQVSNFVVPSAAFRQGDFSAVSTPINDPLSATPFAQNRIPTSRISSVSSYYQSTFYPAPNSGADRFNNIAVFPNRDDQYMGRLDHQISSRNAFFGRAMFHHYEFKNFQDSNPNIGVYDQFRDQYNVVLSDTHTISSNLFNQLRFGYGTDESAYHGPRLGRDVVQASGLQLGDLPNVFAMPAVSITGFQPMSQSDQGGWRWANYYIVESLHYSKGRHNIQVGLDWANFNGTLIPTSPSANYGSYGFNGRFSGNPYADFLLGYMDSSARSTSVSPVYRHRTNWAFYAADSFKVAPRLSLDFSLRYSLLDPGYVEQDLMANFDPTRNALLVPSEAALSRVHPGFPKNVPIAVASSVGLGSKLARRDWNNFAPRAGFAWRPARTERMVIRGGVGVYYVALQPNASDGGGAPFELRESFTNLISPTGPAFSFPRPFPAAGFVLGGTGASGLNTQLRTPYSYQYNFTIEGETLGMGLSATYMSTLSRKNTWTRDLNQPVADTRPYADKFAIRPFRYLASASFTENGGSHSYHALLLKAERRFGNGLFYSTNLTWAKSMGDDWGGVEDAFNRGRERSRGGQIPPLRFVAVGLYELPIGNGKRFAAGAPKAVNYVIGNWSLSGTWVAQKGVYFAPSFSGNDPSFTNRRSGRPDRLADGNLPVGQRTLDRWFDTTAFVMPANGIGRFGTAGDAILEGPGLNVLHFGLVKDLPLYERFRLRLEMASTNFFNHPNFSNPSATVGTSAYGRILGTVGDDGNRNFQLTLRLFF
ncbi:MAG: TonB-dependent receptor [Acidobacteria bacterium]|nr:TonB-dependent receptor [Acidobacteriota bacterium]